MTNRSFVSRLAGAIAALCASQAAFCAAPPPQYGVFVYTDFCVSARSGDLSGNRVTLLRSPDATTLVFEYTDGSTHGVVATDLKLDSPHDAISFAVQPEGAPPSAVSGKFARDGNTVTLRGVPFDGDAMHSLTRVTNFAAPAQACKR